MKQLRVLVACEMSGAVRDAFTEEGHYAVSCDLLPTIGYPGIHIQGDVLKLLKERWDMLIGFPPCTYLCNSGVRHLYNKDGSENWERWNKMNGGAEFFRKLLNANVKRIAIENPIMHSYAKNIIGASQSQIIQPWMFGHLESKATCLWLKNLPLLKPTNDVKEQFMKLDKRISHRIHHLPPSEDRAILRSMTYEGVAKAMAQQWGRL